jgi:hypothetical protein
MVGKVCNGVAWREKRGEERRGEEEDNTTFLQEFSAVLISPDYQVTGNR